MNTIEIKEDCKVIVAKNAMLNNSGFFDVAMANVKIVNANLSDLEIEGAQLGGAYIHNVGVPPKDHPMYDPDTQQRPLRFEDCDLHDSTIINCDLSGIELTNCNIKGLKINGILIEELINQYSAGKSS
jgi:uncharacterized protein YjbI with pentapeptide repeats